MPLRFDSDAAYERWVKERERVELGSPIGAPAAAGRKIRRRLEHEGEKRRERSRAVKHLTRSGHRRRARGVLATLFGPNPFG
jgi:hypothetical protein